MPHYILPYDPFQALARSYKVPLLSLSMLSGDVTVASFWATDEEKWAADYVCDGVCDDVEIQRALDEVPLEGSILLIGPLFNICATLRIRWSCTISGQAQGTTIFQVDGTDLAFMLAAEVGLVTISGALLNLTFDGNAAAQAAGTCAINTYRLADFVLQNIIIENAFADGINADDEGTPLPAPPFGASPYQRVCILMNVRILDSGINGLVVHDPMILTNIRVDAAGQYGIHIRGTAIGTSIYTDHCGTANMCLEAAALSSLSNVILANSSPFLRPLALLLIDSFANQLSVVIDAQFTMGIQADSSGAGTFLSENHILASVYTPTAPLQFVAGAGAETNDLYEISSVSTAITGAVPATCRVIFNGDTHRRNATEAVVTALYSADVQPRMQLTHAGLYFGAGGGAAVDTNLYRSAANVLKTDDALHVTLVARLIGRACIGADADPVASATLELQSITGALLMNRLTTAQRDALVGVDGMTAYNSDTMRFNARGEVNYWDWIMTALHRGQWGEITPGSSTTAFQWVAMYDGASSGILGAFVGAVHAVEGIYGSTVSAAALAAQAGFYTGAVHARRFNPTILIKFELNQTTDERVFIGLADTALATVLLADNPASGVVGIQQPAGNAWWRFIYKDSAGGGVHVHGSIAVDNTVHYLRITLLDTPTCLVEILSAAFVLEDSDTTVLDLPATATALRVCGGVEVTAAAAAHSLNLFYARGWNNTP